MKKILDNVGESVQGVLDGIGDAIQQAGARRQAQYQALAAELGLDADARGRFHGTLDGVRLRRWSEDQGGKNTTDWWTITEYELPRDLPGFLSVRQVGFFDHLGKVFGGTPDLQLGLADLDEALQIGIVHGQDDEARALLLDPTVTDRLRALQSSKCTWRLKHGKLRVGFRGQHKNVGPRGLRLGIDTVKAMDAVLGPPWIELARELDCTLVEPAPTLQGHIDGVPIRVQVQRQDGRILTWILGWFEPHLPEGTEVIHRNRNPKGDVLGDGILDKMVRVESPDPDTLRQRLATDAVRGPLLEVVHGHVGSQLRHDRIMLRIRGRCGARLRERVRLVTDLAKALSA